MLTVYFAFMTLWLAYRGWETYVVQRPQARPYFVGFLITEAVLMPFSVAIELMEGGTLRKRINDARSAERSRIHRYKRSGKPKLIG
jgi:hypothetical protein